MTVNDIQGIVAFGVKELKFGRFDFEIGLRGPHREVGLLQPVFEGEQVGFVDIVSGNLLQVLFELSPGCASRQGIELGNPIVPNGVKVREF